jgi:hypothetical protein
MSDTSTPSSFLLTPDQLPDADLRCRIDTAALRDALRRGQAVSHGAKGVQSNVRAHLEGGLLSIAAYDRERLAATTVPTQPWEAETPGVVCFDPERALAALKHQRGAITVLTASGPAVAIATSMVVTAFARARHAAYADLPEPALAAGPSHKRGSIPREVLDAMERASRVVPRGRGYTRIGLHLSIGGGFAEITAGCADITTRQVVDLHGCEDAPADLEATIAASHWPALARAAADLHCSWQASVGTDDHGVVWLNLLTDTGTGRQVRLHARHLFDPVAAPNLDGFDQGPQRGSASTVTRDRDALAARLRGSGTTIPAAKLQLGASKEQLISTAYLQRALATLPRGFVSLRVSENRLHLAAGGVQTVAALAAP